MTKNQIQSFDLLKLVQEQTITQTNAILESITQTEQLTWMENKQDWIELFSALGSKQHHNYDCPFSDPSSKLNMPRPHARTAQTDLKLSTSESLH